MRGPKSLFLDIYSYFTRRADVHTSRQYDFGNTKL
jgi:hypothetical protein